MPAWTMAYLLKQASISDFAEMPPATWPEAFCLASLIENNQHIYLKISYNPYKHIFIMFL